MDVSFLKRPSAEAIRAALRPKITGEIEVQEIKNTQEVLISTGARDDAALQVVRGDMISTLNAAFNPQAGGKLDINRANAEQMHDALGISLTIARRIVAYRATHGSFTAVSQLLLVPISRATYDRMKDLVTV